MFHVHFKLLLSFLQAWETRNVKIRVLNEYIGISVYSVVVCSVTVIIFANLIYEEATFSFVIITSLILVSTTSTLCLLFLPKMYNIWNNGLFLFIFKSNLLVLFCDFIEFTNFRHFNLILIAFYIGIVILQAIQ